MSNSYWDILGIEQTQDLQLIRNAYRKKLPLYHPETDPQGFQELRAAYEKAQRYAENPDVESDSQQDNAESVQPQDPHHETLERLMNEYQRLLDDPKRCYIEDEWHYFINRLDLEPIEITQQLRWPLLDVTYNTPYLSNDCVAILAERMRWQQRLMELSQESASELDDYINFVARGDDFDLSTLANVDRPAQISTVAYIHMIKSLYWNRPSSELAYFLSMPTVVYWPNDPALLEKVVRWYTQVNVGCDVLLDLCIETLQSQPDNPDWLYFTARQYSLLDDKENAFSYWLRVYYSGNYTEQATAWLIFWCSLHQPEHLPLLIHSMNDSACTEPDISDFEDKRHNYVIPAQTPATLARFTNAAGLSLSPLIESFVKWNLSENRNYRWVVSLLLQDEGADKLLRLYRHGVMLWLGNEKLLNQIISEPESNDPLDSLILQGLKRQARQHLHWLTHSPVVHVFTQWLYSNNKNASLPDIFTREEESLRYYLTEWLRRLRYVPEQALIRLQVESSIQVHELGMFDWISNLFYNGDITFPAPENDDDPEYYWQWYRNNIALLALINDPITNFSYFHKESTLQISKNSPIYEAIQAIKSIALDESDSLPERILSVIPANSRINRIIIEDLPISPESYLQYHDQLDFERVYQQCADNWKPRIESADILNQLLLKAIFTHQTCWIHSIDFVQQLIDTKFDDEALAKVSESLISGGAYPYSRNKDPLHISPVYRELNQAMADLSYSADNLCDNDQIEKMTAYRNDPQGDIVLRLCAGLLLSWNTSRQERLSKEKTTQSHFWQIWRWKSKIGRLGLIYQLLISQFLFYFLSHGALPLLNITSDSTWFDITVIGIVGANTVIALKRRLNDIGYDSFVSACFLILMIIFPPAIILLLFISGMPGANKYGPPPID